MDKINCKRNKFYYKLFKYRRKKYFLNFKFFINKFIFENKKKTYYY